MDHEIDHDLIAVSGIKERIRELIENPADTLDFLFNAGSKCQL
jgi:hypothetical protein